jgi:HPt (histidine-containing phosphotransfer) domain-containing protein
MFEEASIIDEGAIARIQQLEKKTGTPLLLELVVLFSKEAPLVLNQIQSHLEKKDFKSLSAVAHNFKTTAANLGAVRLHNICEQLERNPTELTETKRKFQFEILKKELDLALDELKRRI